MALFMWEMQQATPSVLMWAVLFVRLLAVVAAARPWPLLMLVLVAVAFIPMGRYFLGSPLDRIAVIGVADLVYFACAVAVLVFTTQTTRSAATDYRPDRDGRDHPEEIG